jgi:hypothetical protein
MCLDALKSPSVTVTDMDLERHETAAHPDGLDMSSPDLISDDFPELLGGFDQHAGGLAACMRPFDYGRDF